MKIDFLFVGSSKPNYVEEALDLYLKRLSRFATINLVCTANIKGIKTPEEQRRLEAEQLLKLIGKDDFVVLLDEKGKTFSSVKFAEFIASKKNTGTAKMTFVICGAFGAAASILERSNAILSLSAFTFSHQLARVILAEQVYRGYTIINNHPYHNEG